MDLIRCGCLRFWKIPIEMQHINSPRRYTHLPAYGKDVQSLRQTKPKRESFTKPFRCMVKFSRFRHTRLSSTLFFQISVMQSSTRTAVNRVQR